MGTVNTQYPLQYPAGWKRTQYPQHSRFQSNSAYSESKDIERQLKLMGATKVIVNSNMMYRNDGLPYARQNVEDTGVAVYFELDGQQQCIPCDKWYKLEDNLRAVSKTIEALRGIERWGAKEMMRAAFTGFKALPEAVVTPPPTDWWVELGVDQYASKEVIKDAYRRLAKVNHPDNGGSDEYFGKLHRAYEKGMNQ